MRISYHKLWKMPIDKNMRKSQLRETIGASKSSFVTLGKNENVTFPILLSICNYLNCDFENIMVAIPEIKARRENLYE
ncbi:MAG: helix-turn-helix transcriptional regulator [Lachnospiraceae bacterium]